MIFHIINLLKKNDINLYEKKKDQLSVEIENTGKLKPLFRNITKSSYFNWKLNKYDFELLVINKLLQQRENIIIYILKKLAWKFQANFQMDI